MGSQGKCNPLDLAFRKILVRGASSGIGQGDGDIFVKVRR